MSKYLLLMLVTMPAFAAEEIPKGTVELNTKVYKEKPFRKNKNITVKPMPKLVPHPDALPRKEHREAVFARVPGLESHIVKFDELDRDLLYMRARNNSLEEMREKTPGIPAELLQKLQVEAKKP